MCAGRPVHMLIHPKFNRRTSLQRPFSMFVPWYLFPPPSATSWLGPHPALSLIKPPNSEVRVASYNNLLEITLHFALYCNQPEKHANLAEGKGCTTFMSLWIAALNAQGLLDICG